MKMTTGFKAALLYCLVILSCLELSHCCCCSKKRSNSGFQFCGQPKDKPMDVIAMVNSNIRLYCPVSRNPTARVNWFKRNTSVIGPRFYTSSTSGALQISAVKKTDSNLYTCVVSGWRSRSCGYVQLQVYRSSTARIYDYPPRPKYEGEFTWWRCNGTKDKELAGQPNISWRFNNVTLTTDSRRKVEEGSLKIDHVSVQDAGKYSCVVTTEIDIAEHSTTLEVYARPKVVLIDGGPVVVVGQRVTLLCVLEGGNNSKYWVTWTRESTPNPSVFRKYVKSMTLEISYVSKEDSGLYTCKVNSPIYALSDQFNLTVVDRIENEQNKNATFQSQRPIGDQHFRWENSSDYENRSRTPCPGWVCYNKQPTHSGRVIPYNVSCRDNTTWPEEVEDGVWTSDGRECVACGSSNYKATEIKIARNYLSQPGEAPWAAGVFVRQTLENTPTDFSRTAQSVRRTEKNLAVDQNSWRFSCGATLISPRLVLTARLCVKNNGVILNEPESIRVGFGVEIGERDIAEISPKVSSVARVESPPDSTADDVTLLILTQAVELGVHLMPACLDWTSSPSLMHAQIGSVSGYGRSSTDSLDVDVGYKHTQQSHLFTLSCLQPSQERGKENNLMDRVCIQRVDGVNVDVDDAGSALMVIRKGVHYVSGVVGQLRAPEKNYNVSLYTPMTAFTLRWLAVHWDADSAQDKRTQSGGSSAHHSGPGPLTSSTDSYTTAVSSHDPSTPSSLNTDDWGLSRGTDGTTTPATFSSDPYVDSTSTPYPLTDMFDNNAATTTGKGITVNPSGNTIGNDPPGIDGLINSSPLSTPASQTTPEDQSAGTSPFAASVPAGSTGTHGEDDRDETSFILPTPDSAPADGEFESSESSYAPSIESQEVEFFEEAGGNATLYCEADGSPVPKITWKKKNVSVTLGEHFLQLEDGSLLVLGVGPDDFGQYECEASNGVGAPARSTLHLRQRIPLKVKIYKEGEYLKGGNFSLRCEVEGAPSPSVTWTLNGDYTFSDNVKISDDHTLTVVNAKGSDSGMYVCTANNPYDLVYDQRLVEVKRPKIQ